jgi:predicted glutamine amidotransferase
MCGIVYAFRTDDKPAAKRVMKRYKRQAARGQDGFGYVAISDDFKVQEYRRFMTEAGVRTGLMGSDAKHVLFHHRFPTSTINIAEAAHPILVKHPELKHSYYIVHNGVISNPDEVKPEHEEMGYKYTTEINGFYKATSGKVYQGQSSYNDSEALAIELARTIEGLQPAVRTRGSIAVMALQCDKTGQNVKALYYGTNGGNPLTITSDEAGIVIASEGGSQIRSNVMYRTEFESGDTAEVQVPLPSYYSSAVGYGYNYKPAHDDNEEEDYQPKKYLTAKDYGFNDEDLPDWGEDDELDQLYANRLRIENDISMAQLSVSSGELDAAMHIDDLYDELADATQDIRDYLTATGQGITY